MHKSQSGLMINRIIVLISKHRKIKTVNNLSALLSTTELRLFLDIPLSLSRDLNFSQNQHKLYYFDKRMLISRYTLQYCILMS